MSFWNRISGAPAGPPTHVPSPDQDRTLVLFKYDGCGFCYRVKTAIDRLGLEVPTRDTMREPGAREALRALTGRTQVPCLVIDGEPLLESADIIAWLEAYATRNDAAEG